MSHISRSFVIFLFLCAGLPACATATPLSTTTPFSTETFTPTPLALTATETLAPTPEPTATPTPEVIVPEYIENIKIVNEPLNWRSAPEVDPKDLPALSQVLMKKIEHGEFDASIPVNFHYVPFSYSISGYKYHGITAALNPLVGNPKDLYGMDNRWYFLSSMYKDSTSGSTIAHYFIKQKDGSVGQYFASMGMSVEKAVHGITNDLVGYVKGTDNSYTTPADFSEEGGCLEMTTNDTTYCDYYMSNRDSILELYKEWAKTGFVPKDISNGKVVVPLQGRRAEKP